MKFRPLCTSYRVDALSRLEEVAVHDERSHQLVIEPFVGNVAEESSSESECEKEEVPLPPPRPKVHKRPRLPLEDDASFEYIKREPMQENVEENESVESIRVEKTLPDDISLERSTDTIPESAVRDHPFQDTEDEIDSVYSSSDEEVAVKPLQLVTKVSKLKKRPTRRSDPLTAVFRHPLEDTDDELNGVKSSRKDPLGVKPLPKAVDVSLECPTSPLDSQRQHFDIEDGMNDNDENEPFTTMDEDDKVVSVRAFLLCMITFEPCGSFHLSHMFFALAFDESRQQRRTLSAKFTIWRSRRQEWGLKRRKMRGLPKAGLKRNTTRIWKKSLRFQLLLKQPQMHERTSLPTIMALWTTRALPFGHLILFLSPGQSHWNHSLISYLVTKGRNTFLV